MASSSDEFYLSPEIDAREDGLCPTKLPDDYTGSVVDTEELIISYEANSQLLNREIREKEDASAELEFLCESISKFVLENVDEEEQRSALISLDFEIEGCIWKLDLNPNLAAPGLQIHVTLLAKDGGHNGTIWVTQSYLVDLNNDELVMTKAEVKKHPTAKAALEQTALVIRKAVIKCELPEFPEGGKGRHFKEVYKLNAKVSSDNMNDLSLVFSNQISHGLSTLSESVENGHIFNYLQGNPSSKREDRCSEMCEASRLTA